MKTFIYNIIEVLFIGVILLTLGFPINTLKGIVLYICFCGLWIILTTRYLTSKF